MKKGDKNCYILGLVFTEVSNSCSKYDDKTFFNTLASFQKQAHIHIMLMHKNGVELHTKAFYTSFANMVAYLLN